MVTVVKFNVNKQMSINVVLINALTHMTVFLDGFIALLKTNFHRLLRRSRTFGPTNTQPILRNTIAFCPSGTLILMLLPRVTKIRNEDYTKKNDYIKYYIIYNII